MAVNERKWIIALEFSGFNVWLVSQHKDLCYLNLFQFESNMPQSNSYVIKFKKYNKLNCHTLHLGRLLLLTSPSNHTVIAINFITNL